MRQVFDQLCGQCVQFYHFGANLGSDCLRFVFSIAALDKDRPDPLILRCIDDDCDSAWLGLHALFLNRHLAQPVGITQIAEGGVVDQEKRPS